MSEDIKKKIYEIIEKYENPVNNRSFNAKDKIFNIILKQGNLNISLEINPSEAQKYDLLVDKIKDNQLSIDDINETMINENLLTKDIPDPDLLIRTGNTKRISNYMLWQLAYSEIYFEKKLWKDFTIKSSS